VEFSSKTIIFDIEKYTNYIYMRSVSDINSTKINDSEYTFLRSCALGLSDLSIQQMLSLDV